MGILWGIFSKIAGCKKYVNDLKFTEPRLLQLSIKCTLNTSSFWNALEKGLKIECPDLRVRGNWVTKKKFCLHIVYVVPLSAFFYSNFRWSWNDSTWHACNFPSWRVHICVVPTVFACCLLTHGKMGVAIFCWRCWSEPCVPWNLIFSRKRGVLGNNSPCFNNRNNKITLVPLCSSKGLTLSAIYADWLDQPGIPKVWRVLLFFVY